MTELADIRRVLHVPRAYADPETANEPVRRVLEKPSDNALAKRESKQMLLDLVPQLKSIRWRPERGSDGRRCGKCKLVKALSEFGSRGGELAYERKSWCKMCENEYKRDKYNSRRAR